MRNQEAYSTRKILRKNQKLTQKKHQKNAVLKKDKNKNLQILTGRQEEKKEKKRIPNIIPKP